MQTTVVLAVPVMSLIEIIDIPHRITVVSNTSKCHYAPQNLEMSVLGGPATGFC